MLPHERKIRLKILRYVLSLITFSLAMYGLISGNFEFMHLMLFLLGLTMLVAGIEEFQKEKKTTGILLFIVFAFALFVSIQGFILRLS